MTADEVSVLSRRIAEAPSLIHLAPAITRPDDGLKQVVSALASDPRPGVVFVADEEDRLLGWISEDTLDSDVLVAVLPGDRWLTSGEMDTPEIKRAARSLQQTAREMMDPAGTATPDITLRDAITSMSNSRHRVLALVDDQQRLLGYVTLFDILAAVLREL